MAALVVLAPSGLLVNIISQTIEESQQMRGVIWTEGGMTVEDPSVANYVPPLSLASGKIESCCFNRDEFTRSVSGNNIKDSLQKS